MAVELKVRALGAAVMRTPESQSEQHLGCPPVTAERSPPGISRITGADLTGDRGLRLTEGDAFDHFRRRRGCCRRASDPGTISPTLRLGAGYQPITLLAGNPPTALAWLSVRVLRNVSALRLAAALPATGLGKIGEQHREPQPTG